MFNNEVIHINYRKERGRREHFFPNQTKGEEDREEIIADEGDRKAEINQL